MAWGSGTYTVQNKILPGAYFKFESEPGTNNIFGDRGTVAVADIVPWGASGITTITRDEFIRNSEKYLGYPYAHEKMKPWRELFFGAQKVVLYRLGTGVHASNANAKARYAGERGNALSIAITAKDSQFIVDTKIDGRVVDSQTVAAAKDLVANDWVTFTTAELKATEEATPLSNGTNGTALAKDHQDALNAFESYHFDALVCLSADESIKTLYKDWTKNAVEKIGKFHQLIVYRDSKADNRYITSVHNTVTDQGAPEYAALYYVAGCAAGCAVNKDLTGHDYTGEYQLDGNFTQAQLEELLLAGQFVYHRVDDVFTVLLDVNTYKSWSDENEEGYRYNQTIRVLNQRANDVKKLFTKFYLGKSGTDQNARMLFKNDLVSNMTKGLVRVGAVTDYVPEDTVVERGESVRAYHVRERIKPNMAVTHLYHDIVLSKEGE